MATVELRTAQRGRVYIVIYFYKFFYVQTTADSADTQPVANLVETNDQLRYNIILNLQYSTLASYNYLAIQLKLEHFKRNLPRSISHVGIPSSF